ncbi:MAG: hypothetical protein A3F72_21585, partial [Bacteroidetes bacterium RIFCSPLOWO2_12_FULL_35_15]
AGYQWNTISTYPGSGVNVVATPTYTQTGLTCNTGYTLYVWAYNSCGISTSTTLTQTTSACPPPTAPACGTQIFAASNLNVGTMINSNPVPPAAQSQQTNNGIVEKYCYNNVAANCATYGGLYEFWEAVNYAAINCYPCCDPCGAGGTQGQCPAGFHVPTDAEWCHYEACVETTIAPTGTTTQGTFQTTTGWRGSATAGVGPGDKMKATSGNTPAWDGTNTSGFLALPGGYRIYSTGGFSALNTDNYFWTATYWAGSGEAVARHLSTGSAQSFRNLNTRTQEAYSIRCIQN